MTCPATAAASVQGNDCDDNKAAVNPGKAELCDGIDNNCSLTIDEGCNADGDGYCDASRTTVGNPAICFQGGGDCNDGSGTVHPGATELCNGLDENCNGSTDEDACDTGLSESAAGKSCATIFAAHPTSTTGTYWIKPLAGPATQVYCDMTTDGGGWTLVMQVASSVSGDGVMGWQSSHWSTGTVLNGTPPTALSNINAKYDTFNTFTPVAGKLLIRDKKNSNFTTLLIPGLAGNTLLNRFTSLGKTNLTVTAGKPSPQELMGFGAVSGLCGTNAPWMMNFLVSNSGARLGNDVATNSLTSNNVSTWPCYNGEESNLSYSGVGGTLESGRQWQDGFGSESLERYRAGQVGTGSHDGVALFVK